MKYCLNCPITYHILSSGRFVHTRAPIKRLFFFCLLDAGPDLVLVLEDKIAE